MRRRNIKIGDRVTYVLVNRIDFGREVAALRTNHGVVTDIEGDLVHVRSTGVHGLRCGLPRRFVRLVDEPSILSELVAKMEK